MMCQRIDYKIKGMTLVEVLVSLVIGTVSACLCSLIFIQLNAGAAPFQRLKATILAEKHMRSCIADGLRDNASISEGGYEVRHTVQKHEEYPDRLIVRVIVLNGKQRKMCDLEQIIPANGILP